MRVVVFTFGVIVSAALGQEATAYRVGKVLTMDADDRVVNNAVVIVKDGKIERVGRAREVAIPEGARVVEMPSAWLVPGFIEAHNHTAAASPDLHDYVYLTNPGLRTLDSFIPEQPATHRALSGGVTTALLISGSGTNMSGFGTVVKFKGTTVEDSVVKFPGSIKIAQAGNPERYWYGVGRSMQNYNTRQTLEKALAYHRAWEAFEKGDGPKPRFDPTFDDFRGLFRREFVASVHTQQFQLVLMTIDMLSRRLGIRVTIDHGTFDGWKVTRVLLDQPDKEIYTMNGPRQLHFDRTQRKIHGNAARWWQSGQHKLGVNTDSPVVPQEELPYQAAIACWHGWLPYEATKGITRIAAESLMINDRLGSIEAGKDATFCLWDGDPIDPRSTCLMAVIDGMTVRDVAKDGRRF